MTNLDTPEFAVAPENRIPVNNYPSQMQAIPPSRMFEIKNALDKYIAKAGAGAVTYDASQGDGGASLPGVPADILQRAAELQIKHGTGYDQPFGTAQFRKVTAEKYWKLDAASGWSPENIIFVQGGRDGLNKAYNAMYSLGHGRIGDLLVVSRVPWISYNWGPYGVGLNVLRAPGHPEDGWAYSPDSIKATGEFAEKNGYKIAGLVITSPDNPTGRTTPLEEQIELAQVALRSGYAYVLFDWIYHWVTDGGPSDINTVLQAFSPEDRERLMFLDGLTKSLGASNIRSAHLVAGSKVIKHINGQASHGIVPSYYAQAVAIAAYDMGFMDAAKTILEPTKQSRGVLRQALEQQGVPFIMGDGYYAFIDVTKYIENGTRPDGGKFKDSGDLGAWLGENYGVTVVPGVYFSDAGANWVRFSYALPPEKTGKAIERMFEGLNSLL
ncbi:MAG TPA: pyridoxal phosphate-dependent aminotransferase [Phototrophicaceae bacterium]|nr:pyridoxal phosphate-dependent aminotransferase [Phototrophicaceae bacterium]